MFIHGQGKPIFKNNHIFFAFYHFFSYINKFNFKCETKNVQIHFYNLLIHLRISLSDCMHFYCFMYI